MINRRELSIGVLAMMACCDLAIAQERAVGSEKLALINALQEIQEQVHRIHKAPGNSGLAMMYGIYASLRWFEDAATRWSPTKPGEGLPLF